MSKTRWLKENDPIYDDPGFDINDDSQFVSCSCSHPLELDLCRGNEADLKKCKRFEYEDDVEDGETIFTCAHCHGLGFKGVCELHLKGGK